MAAVISRTDEINDVLRTEILSGQYRAGERLPSERELAVRFEANRGVIREVIKKLEQLGIVAVNPGGVRVQPLEQATLDVLGYLLELDEVTRPELLAQTIDVMSSMMALSAHSAVAVASDEQHREIAARIQDLMTTISDQEKHHESWQAFSEYLQSVHGNLVLRLVGNGLRTQFLGRTQRGSAEFNPDPPARLSALEQLKVAAVAGDTNGVAIAVRAYFAVIRTAIPKAIESSGVERRSRHG